MGNQQTSVLHEPQHRPMASASSTVSQPKKSVIKRTRSVLKEAGSLNKLGNDPTMRFLPKGINPGHGGIIYPTNPNAQSAGYISPEGWGWYITTTPPTPDMYHHSSKQAKKIGAQHSAAAKRPSALTNPAFKAGAHKTAMGWPSVPLWFVFELPSFFHVLLATNSLRSPLISNTTQLSSFV